MEDAFRSVAWEDMRGAGNVDILNEREIRHWARLVMVSVCMGDPLTTSVFSHLLRLFVARKNYFYFCWIMGLILWMRGINYSKVLCFLSKKFRLVQTIHQPIIAVFGTGPHASLVESAQRISFVTVCWEESSFIDLSSSTSCTRLQQKRGPKPWPASLRQRAVHQYEFECRQGFGKSSSETKTAKCSRSR